MLDLPNFNTSNIKYYEFMSDKKGLKNWVATAIYNISLGSSLIINYPKATYKPDIPVAVFQTKSEANG